MGTNKRAIVMGASSGMGREVARLLLAKGWHVGLAARRKSLLDELCNEYPQLAVSEQVDVTKPDAEERLHALIDRLGGMDVYVHMSGIGKQNLELESDIELDTVDTNGLGFTRLVGAAFRYFRDKKRDEIGENATFEAENDAICLANNAKSVAAGGHIVAISSIAGTKGLGPAPSYSATKAFQNTYLEALEQLSTNLYLGISITDIRPGFVDTQLIEGSNFPLKLNAQIVAYQIVNAIEKKPHIRIIDWRYRFLVAGWRLLPRCVWRRLPLCRPY
jgi:short-subunit dehydrogenase